MPFCAQAAFQWTIKYLATHLTGTFPSETIACKDICKYTHSVLADILASQAPLQLMSRSHIPGDSHAGTYPACSKAQQLLHLTQMYQKPPPTTAML